MLSFLFDGEGGPRASGPQAMHAAAGCREGGPTVLTGGADCQEQGEGPRLKPFTVSIHDLTLSGCDYLREGVVRTLTRVFGEPESVVGQLFYRQGIGWEAGAQVFWEPVGGGDHFTMRVRGSAWDLLTFAEQVQLLQELEPGMKATRIDLACDFRDAGLCEAVERACERRQLSGARQWDVVKKRCASTGVLRGHTVYLGSRQSPRFTRVYDKGLEQASKGRGEWAPGMWERWEVELKQDAGDEAFKLMVKSKTPGETLAGIVFGAVDFLQGEDAHLERRVRVSWFEQLTRGLHLVRLKVKRIMATLESYVHWLTECVRPRLVEIATICSQQDGVVFEPGECFEALTAGRDDAMRGAGLLARQAAQVICGPPGDCSVPF